MPANGLHAAFVTATIGTGTLASLDASDALAAPGVAKFLTADDIPPGRALARLRPLRSNARAPAQVA